MHFYNYGLFAKELIKGRLVKKKRPLIAVLAVTNHCNLQCWYCYGAHYYKKDWPDFSTGELINIIKRLWRQGVRVIQLQGGEPLLREDLKAVIAEVKRRNMVCDMVTNGILIPRRKKIIKLLDKVCISLDGPEKLNDKNRGKGTYKRILEGIKAARRLRIPVRISAVLTSDSKTEDIDWLLDFARANNTRVNFSPSFRFISCARGDNFKPHFIPDKKLRQLFLHIAERKENGVPIQFTAKSYRLAAEWPFSYKKKIADSGDKKSISQYPSCYHGDYVVFIDSDGSVYPCCNFWGRSNLNIKKDGIEESIKRLSRRGCSGCYIPAYIDRNLFFAADREALFNYARQTIRGQI